MDYWRDKMVSNQKYKPFNVGDIFLSLMVRELQGRRLKIIRENLQQYKVQRRIMG